MITAIISRLVILVFGTLYPAYASYKTVKSKNLRDYVKWMMYWIVFAIFTCLETITDIFLSWFPFYYEIKIVIVIWLLSPATKGATFLYRKFVHPILSEREQEIDDYIAKAKEQSYKQVIDISSKGMNALMQTALKSGGGLVNQIKKSYSLSDLSERQEEGKGDDETDLIVQQNVSTRLLRKRQSLMKIPPTTSASMFFSEIDVRTQGISTIKSAEDLSSGYSSTNDLLPQMGKKDQINTRSGGSMKAKPTKISRSGSGQRKATTTDVLESEPRSDSSSGDENDEFLDSLPEEDSSAGNACSDNVIQLDAQLLETTNIEPIENQSQDPQPNEAGLVSDSKNDSFVRHERSPVRAGKYHKLAAPEPPSAITATLVLQPGVVKPIGDGEVFCRSPKLRRRSRSKTPSPKSDRKFLAKRSPSSSSSSSPMMARLMGLFKHDLGDTKRMSWHGSSSNDDD